MNWYYSDGEKQIGPVPEEQLIELRRSGVVTADSLVWREGMANWMRYQEAGPAVNLDAATPTTAQPPLIPVPPYVQPAAHEAMCVECGKVFPKEEMITHGTAHVCVNCKPAFVQKLSEGARIGIPGYTASLRYAGFWIRFGARMLDGILISIVVYVPIIIIVLATGGNMEQALGRSDEFGRMQLLILIWQLFFYVLYAGYEIFFIGKYGATPGKMVCKICVVTSHGEKLTYAHATGRFFANILSALICYIGFIIAGFDKEKRALHDHICNTRVIFKD